MAKRQDRRDLIRQVMAGVALGGGSIAMFSGESAARGYRKRRRKRCRHQCKNNRKTCDKACNILDGESQQLCKQGCRVGMSQCRANC